MPHRGLLVVIVSVALLSCAGFSVAAQPPARSPEPDRPGLVDMRVCGACALVEADQAYGVPPSFNHQQIYTLSSPDGGYFHKDGVCDCFVADVLMSDDSNLTPYPTGDPTEVHVMADAIDLPSSTDSDQVLPGTRTDCQRYYRAIRMWEKREGQEEWAEVKSDEVVGGEWTGSTCRVKSAGAAEIGPSTTSTARTLRVAVKVLLRDSAQKAKVKVFLPGPG